MRNLKRVLSLALAAIMLMGMMVMGTSAASVSDFNDADQIGNVEAASIVTGLGIFAGDTSGNFDPQRPVTRAEMATVICKILYGSDVNGDNFKGTGTFADAKTYQGGWAEGYINMCKSQGIVSGYNDTTFGAADTVTTWQAALMLQRALGYWAPAAGESISELTVTEKATRLGLYGDLTLSVDEPLTRENVAVLVFNTLFAQRVELRNGNYVKASDFNVVPTTSIDEMNTLAQNTFGLYSVDGVVTENGYTNMYLTDKSKVVFDDSKDVTGDSKVEAEYTFDYETGLDLIGHAVTVYYRINRKAPSVYTIVDQAEKVEVTTVGDNFSTTARNAGFSRDTSDTKIVYNYDLEKPVDDYTDYSSDPVILISNSSNLVVDYAIVVDQELDYVTSVRVNNADKDHPVTTYSMTVLSNKTDDINAVALNDIEKDQYVITVKIEDRGINDDLYLIKTAETEQEIITKVTRRLNTTTGLASAGMDYDKSAVNIDSDLEDLSKSAIIPYIDVESKGEYILVFDDFFRNLIGVYPLTEDRVVNYAYVAQFGYNTNPGDSLNNKYVLKAHIYFADGTNGVYPVDTGVFTGNLFRGSVNNSGQWVPSGGTPVPMATLNDVTAYSDHEDIPGNNYGVKGAYIGLYNVKITDSGKARITAIPTLNGVSDPKPEDVNTLRKGVTFMDTNLYANSNTVYFLVDGKYNENIPGNGLTVKAITGVADLPNIGILSEISTGKATLASAIKLHWVNQGTPATGGYGLTAAASDDAIVAELYTSAKTGYNAVDAVLIGGYRVEAELGDTVYFYAGHYTITKNNGKWDLNVEVRNASTGEYDTITYSGYDTDQKARDQVEDLDIGYYVDGGNKNRVLSKVADTTPASTGSDHGTLQYTSAGNRTYVVSGNFQYFTKQGDILTLYTDKNTDAYGVVASDAEIVDLTGNRIGSLQELSDLIEARRDLYNDNSVTPPSTSALLSFRFGQNNKVDYIFVTEVMKPYDKDYTSGGSNDYVIDIDYTNATDPTQGITVETNKPTMSAVEAVQAILDDMATKFTNVSVKNNTDSAVQSGRTDVYVFTAYNGAVPVTYYFDSASSITDDLRSYTVDDVPVLDTKTISVTGPEYVLYKAKGASAWTAVNSGSIAVTNGMEIKTAHLKITNTTVSYQGTIVADPTERLNNLVVADSDNNPSTKEWYVKKTADISPKGDKLGTGLIYDSTYTAYDGTTYDDLEPSGGDDGTVDAIDLGYVTVDAGGLHATDKEHTDDNSGKLTLTAIVVKDGSTYAKAGGEVIYTVTYTVADDTYTGTDAKKITISGTGIDTVKNSTFDTAVDAGKTVDITVKVGNVDIEDVVVSLTD